MKLYLASTSPRRYELLSSLGIPFERIAPTFEEKPTSLLASEETLYFAEQKARSVENNYPNALIIASDTLIECEGAKMGKPNDKEEAISMLQQLSDKTHQLFTAVVLLNTKTKTLKKHVESVAVTFKRLSLPTIEGYVATGEAFGKAGAYAIQEEGAALVKKIEGDKNAVIGLPLEPLRNWLKPFYPSLCRA